MCGCGGSKLDAKLDFTVGNSVTIGSKSKDWSKFLKGARMVIGLGSLMLNGFTGWAFSVKGTVFLWSRENEVI